MPTDTSPTARQFLLRLLSALADEPLDAASAVRAAALFDISSNNVRVSLTRLQASGHIRAVARGQYQLGPAARGISADLASWRDVEQRVRPWNGDWIAVETSGLSRLDRHVNRNRERALSLTGLRPLERTLYIRPDNLKGGVTKLCRRLEALGLESEAPIFVASNFTAKVEAKARRLWQTRTLETTYRRLREQLDHSLARLPLMSPEEAARETFFIGDRALHTLVFDPLLPEPLISTSERHLFINAMRRYDSTGQRIWRELLTSLKDDC